MNDCLDCRVCSCITRVICKLDIEKSYRHVNRDALIYLLGRFGFSGENGYSCVSTVWFFILD